MPRHSDENAGSTFRLPLANTKLRTSLSLVEPVFLQKKFDDHRVYTSVVLGLYCVYGVCAWLIDYVSDPVFAGRTFWFRMASICFLAAAIAILNIKSYRRGSAVVLACIFFDLILNCFIIQFLDGNLPGGILLFAYFPLGATLVCLGLSVKLSLWSVFTVSVLPIVFALFNWTPPFAYALYAAVIGPEAAGLMILTCAFAWNYHQRFLLERALEEASNTDPLTGVANRRQFNAVLRREVSRSGRLNHQCSLLMLDIDHFKKINDTHGHPTGDRVICALADICMDITREVDWVARVGGEEFAVLVPETSLDEALLLAERIRKTVEQYHIVSDNGAQVEFTVSIGVVCTLPDSENHHLSECERLITSADKALYEAKSSGRNCVIAHRDNAKVTS